MNKNDQKIQLLTIDELTTIVFIGSVLVTLYITNNDLNKLKGKEYNETGNLELYNRILGVVLLIVFLYLSFKNYDIAKDTNNDLTPYILQIISSILALISGLIVLYIVIYNKGFVNLENPEV